MKIMYTHKYHLPFLIDDEDEESVSNYKWYMNWGRPTTKIPVYHNDVRIGLASVHIHLFLLGKAPEGLEWDHIDRDPTNNQRHNIRAVTHVHNLHNQPLRSNNTSGYNGIYPTKWGTFGVDIFAGKRIGIGTFKTLEEAIAARKAAEDKYWGDQR
jgi:hypothetical protein